MNKKRDVFSDIADLSKKSQMYTKTAIFLLQKYYFLVHLLIEKYLDQEETS